MRCKSLIFGLFFVLVSLVELICCLPVTSKALENSSDQLIWQSSWFDGSQDGHKSSPFVQKNVKSHRKFTKSIFIIPDQNKCNEGYKHDERGNCIRIVSINQDDLLVTRLQNIFPQHQTTDESTGLDYDYPSSNEEDDNDTNPNSNQPTHVDLPLIPIIDDNDTSIYTVKTEEENVGNGDDEENEKQEDKNNQGNNDNSEPPPEFEFVQYGIEVDNSSFRDEIDTNSTGIFVQSLPSNILKTNDSKKEMEVNRFTNDSNISNNSNSYGGDDSEKEEKNTQQNYENENESDDDDRKEIEQSNNNGDGDDDDKESGENVTQSTLEFQGGEEESSTMSNLSDDTTTTTEFRVNENDSEIEVTETTTTTTTTKTDEHVMTYNLESFEEKSQTEKAISNSSSNSITMTTMTPIRLVDDYFDAMLLNDSLIVIDDTSTYSNVTEMDYDITTNVEMGQEVETTTTTATTETADFNDEPSSALSRLPAENDENLVYSSTTTTLPTTTSNIIREVAQNNFKHENRIINSFGGFDESQQQNIQIDGIETSKKYEYHHEVGTLTPPPLPPPPVRDFVRFPSDDDIERKQLINQASSQVKFPDEPAGVSVSRQPSLFTWPRDKSYVSFWRDQPLINDSKAFSSSLSRGVFSSFSRHHQTPYHHHRDGGTVHG